MSTTQRPVITTKVTPISTGPNDNGAPTSQRDDDPGGKPCTTGMGAKDTYIRMTVPGSANRLTGIVSVPAQRGVCGNTPSRCRNTTSSA